MSSITGGLTNMSNLANILLGVAVICLVTSFVARGSAVLEGLGKALFGTFLILFFIVRFFGEKNA
jgi:hypothetical protein